MAAALAFPEGFKWSFPKRDTVTLGVELFWASRYRLWCGAASYQTLLIVSFPNRKGHSWGV